MPGDDCVGLGWVTHFQLACKFGPAGEMVQINDLRKMVQIDGEVIGVIPGSLEYQGVFNTEKR